MINWILIHLEDKAGIRTKEVTATHGFRKFFTTQVINAKVNPEIREIDMNFKPTMDLENGSKQDAKLQE